VRSGAEPRRKSNFVHFSLEIWHQLESNLLIFLWESIINQSVSRVRLNLGGLATIWGCLCNPPDPGPSAEPPLDALGLQRLPYWRRCARRSAGWTPAVRAMKIWRQRDADAGRQAAYVDELPASTSPAPEELCRTSTTSHTLYSLPTFSKGWVKKSKLLYCDRYFKG